MSRTGWIILASVLVVGAGLGTFFIVRSMNKGKEEDKKESDK
jgi:hypothetical protein